MNVHDLTKDKDPEYSDGFALKGEMRPPHSIRRPNRNSRSPVQAAGTGSGKPVFAEPVDLSETDLTLETPAGCLPRKTRVIIVMDERASYPTSKQRMKRP